MSIDASGLSCIQVYFSFKNGKKGLKMKQKRKKLLHKS